MMHGSAFEHTAVLLDIKKTAGCCNNSVKQNHSYTAVLYTVKQAGGQEVGSIRPAPFLPTRKTNAENPPEKTQGEQEKL